MNRKSRMFIGFFAPFIATISANAATVMPVWRNDTAANILSFNDTFAHQIAIGSYNPSTGAWSVAPGSISVAESFTGGLVSVSGSPVTGSGVLALTVAGTSGGIPYFSSSSTWASSAALAANQIVLGGGAAVAPSTPIGLGTVTQLLHGNASGAPTFGPIVSADIATVLASPPSIGLTTPNSAAFTTLNAAYQNTIAPGVRGQMFIWSNCDNTTLAGQDCGLQVWTGNNPTATPAAANPITATFAMVNGNNRGAGPLPIETMNIIALQCGTAEGCTTAQFVDTALVGIEIDMVTSASFSTRNRVFNATAGSYNRVAFEVQNSPGIAPLTAAFMTWGASANLAATFYEGLDLASISDIGVHFTANPIGRTDLFTAFSVCALCDDSNSTTFAKFGNFTHTGAMIDVSSGATFTGGFYKGITAGDTNVLFTNGVDHNDIITIDSGTSAMQQSMVNFKDRTTLKWQVGKQNDNTFVVLNTASGNASMVVAANDAATFKSSLTYGSASLPSTTVSFTNDAAAQTATITNGPVAGNPKKWIPINDNGTLLDIPAWCHTGGC